jgi:hypothetical protein
MADKNPISFLLNQSQTAIDSATVTAPAFSLTKVLASAAIIITPISAYLVDQLSKVTLSAGNYVALAAALLGFLAIASAADVLGRSYATAASNEALSGLGQVVMFNTPIPGTHLQPGPDIPVQVLASAHVDGGAMVLVSENGASHWFRLNDEVTIP